MIARRSFASVMKQCRIHEKTPGADDIHQHNSGCTLNALSRRHAGEQHRTLPVSLIQDGYRKRCGKAAQDRDECIRRHVSNNFDAPIITTTTELKTDPATESRHLSAVFGGFRLDRIRNSTLWLSPSIYRETQEFRFANHVVRITHFRSIYATQSTP